MKDHKQQLQSRLDNLSKINEKSTGINEQLAELKAVAEALARQREMIDGLLARVSREEAAVTAPATATRSERTVPNTPPELMETTKLSVFDAPLTISRRAARAQEVFREVAHVKEEEPPKPAVRKPAAPAAPAAAPMISDDMLSALSRADPGQTIDQRGGDGEKTQRLPAFDPRLYNPDGSRKKEPPAQAQPAGAEKTQQLDLTRTQRLDLSIEKLQEAKRRLQDISQKP
jgi:hypothetical protein